MLRQFKSGLMVQKLCRQHSQNARATFHREFRPKHAAFIASSTVVASAIVWHSSKQVIHNDAPSGDAIAGVQVVETQSVTATDENGALRGLVWGSNKSNLISPRDSEVDSIRTPAVASWLQNVALRDLALHEKHAACVDARGDVYQWGDGFFGPANIAEGRHPRLTLQGKNITKLQITDTRIFALSASGKVFVFDADGSKQTTAGKPSPPRSWWSLSSLWRTSDPIDFAEVVPQQKLAWGEKFISIAAGNDHVLALTSKGRTFAHPVNRSANAYGQLGFRKFDVPNPSPTKSEPPRLSVELIPKSILDPYAKSSPYTRQSSLSSASLGGSDLSHLDDGSIRFCDKLFELPALKGVEVAKIAAGGRSSFVLTTTGKVLGWGANEYGQIGLGSNVTLDTITVPTEVILWRSVSGRTRTRCKDIYTGGDLVCFAVERTDESARTTMDLLMCGNGRWGGLGNNVFSNAQGNPVRARNVSGLLEYSEVTQGLQPILPHSVSISPTGHVLLTLDTLARSGPGGEVGRDLVVWGKNHEYELGNGKKSSLPTPTTLYSTDGGRLMLRKIKAKEVRDLNGKVWGRGIDVEQHAVAGYGNSLIYWRIC